VCILRTFRHIFYEEYTIIEVAIGSIIGKPKKPKSSKTIHAVCLPGLNVAYLFKVTIKTHNHKIKDNSPRTIIVTTIPIANPFVTFYNITFILVFIV